MSDDPLGAKQPEPRQAIRTYNTNGLAAIVYPCGCRASGGLMLLPEACPIHGPLGAVPVEPQKEYPRERTATERLIGQAHAISVLLAEANVGACPITEGVRLLLNRAEAAERQLAQVRALVAAVDSYGSWREFVARLRHILGAEGGRLSKRSPGALA